MEKCNPKFCSKWVQRWVQVESKKYKMVNISLLQRISRNLIIFCLTQKSKTHCRDLWDWNICYSWTINCYCIAFKGLVELLYFTGWLKCGGGGGFFSTKVFSLHRIKIQLLFSHSFLNLFLKFGNVVYTLI